MSISYNALSGALAAQAALNTTSQNLSNLQTKGYTRQGVLLASSSSGGGGLAAGNGVNVASLIRYSDSFKNQQMWSAASDLGQHTQTQPYLTQLEQVMGDTKSGISAGVDQFFAAMNAAGVDPTSSPLRQQVVTAANAMAQHINSIYNVTSSQVATVQQERSAMIPQLNESLKGIATLNEQIGAAAAVGTNVSGLTDQRDQLIDSVSSLVAVQVTENTDGSTSLALQNGQPLVSGNLASKLNFDNTTTGPVLTLTFANTKYTTDDTKVGGALGGLGDFLVNTLKPLQKSIADMTQQMSDKVNSQLAAGFDASGNPGTSMFVFNPASAIGVLQVVDGFQATSLAFSGDGTPGDNANLQKLIDIKNQPVTLSSIGSVLLGDADTQLVGKLGIDSQQNQALLNTSTTIRQQSEDNWKTTSGVNSDEEAVNLVEYQNMYQANMKVISVANSLFDATLQMFN